MDKDTLKRMKEVDIETIDLADLVDIREVKIDENLEIEERILMYLKQIKNPYCVKYKDIKIQMEFAEEGPDLNEKIREYLEDRMM
ncbi:hypothetical protein LJC58_05285 [Lachnospiraceae bacterium OttesenSCG-928-D06]|nr:hypothetical protein [Lachnospiraceae bacterium OttesenSCG-928-D06]